MNRTEQRQMIAALDMMQHQFEAQMNGGGCLMVTIPGTNVKHVYSNDIA